MSVFEEVIGEISSGFGIDGCFVFNYVVSFVGMVWVMGFFVGVNFEGDVCNCVVYCIYWVMVKYLVLIFVEGCVCECLINVVGNKIVVKIGVEVFFIVILFE